MVSAASGAAFPSHFQRESLNLIDSLIEVKSAAFYLINPDFSHKGIVTCNMDRQDDKLYQNRYMASDPLNPALHEKGDDTVVHMDSILAPHVIEQLAYYQDFLKPLDYRFVADMFFRADDKIIAVITLLRSEAQGDFSADDLMLLRKLQPFLEFTLNTVYLPPRLSERRSIEQRYQLTARELDVVERLISGASNKAIAEEMMLGLPTVKTHLQHIYQKANVVSRAELLSRIIADLQEDA